MAVRVIVKNEEGGVLIIQRAPGQTDAGKWCLPGGKVDYGETVENAVRRELREEANLNAKNLRFLFYQDSLPQGDGIHYINLYFRCDAEGQLALNEESTDAQWIGPHDLGTYHITFLNDEGLQRYWSEDQTWPS